MFGLSWHPMLVRTGLDNSAICHLHIAVPCMNSRINVAKVVDPDDTCRRDGACCGLEVRDMIPRKYTFKRISHAEKVRYDVFDMSIVLDKSNLFTNTVTILAQD